MLRFLTPAKTIVNSFSNLHAGSFDGATAYVDYGATAYNIEYTQPFTFNIWVNPSDYASGGSGGSCIFGNQNTATIVGFECGFNDGGTPRTFIELLAGSTFLFITYPPATLNIYTMLTWTSDGTGTAAGTKLYLNASLQTGSVSFDNLAGSIVSGENARLGAAFAFGVPSSLYSGLMDEFSFKLSVLNQSDITALYNGGTPISVSADHWSRFESTVLSPPDDSSTIYDRGTGTAANGTNHNVTFSTTVP